MNPLELVLSVSSHNNYILIVSDTLTMILVLIFYVFTITKLLALTLVIEYIVSIIGTSFVLSLTTNCIDELLCVRNPLNIIL